MNQMMIVGVLNRCLGAGASEKEVRCASEWLRSLMRRDWAVRVLDAHQEHDGRAYVTVTAPFQFETKEWGHKFALGRYSTADAARHAAALAVFSTLDRNAPNWPGDEP